MDLMVALCYCLSVVFCVVVVVVWKVERKRTKENERKCEWRLCRISHFTIKSQDKKWRESS